MGENEQMALFWFLGCSAIAGLTWFFSSRRNLFIRTFVPGEDHPEASDGMPQNGQFQKGMRLMACIQFAAAIVVSPLIWYVLP